MKKTTFFTFVKIPLVILLLAQTSFLSMAQQNIFNVPSVEVTMPKKVFLQQQFNIGQTIQSNTTFDYGLRRFMEVGLNLFNVSYFTPSERMFVNPGKDTVFHSAYAPLLMGNFLKQWEITSYIKVGLGTQMGANIPLHKEMRYTGFYYFSSSCSFFRDHLKTDAGVYYGNRFYLGTEHAPGIMLGAEWSILHDKVHITGDWLSGIHDLGIGVVGLVLYPEKALPVSLGYQIPNSKIGNQAFVVEFTYIQSHRPSKKNSIE
jgi:hypothetical protein